MNRPFMKYYINTIKWMRSMGYLKEPKRSYLYNGVRLPFYNAPVHATSEGALYLKPAEFFNSVNIRKQIDQLLKYKIVNGKLKKTGITESPLK